MTSVNLNYMVGNLIGRAIVISLFAYILWYIYNMNMNMVPVIYTKNSADSVELVDLTDILDMAE